MISRDLIYGLKTLRKNPGFTAIVTVILALGLGANSAIFSVLNAVILRPLPYPAPERLMMLPAVHEPNDKGAELSVPNYLDWRRESRSFAQMGAYAPASFNLSGGGAPERIRAAQVTPSALAALGVQPRLGRLFGPADEQADAHIAILSYGLWRSHFAADPAIVGKVVHLGGVAYPIVGVMPPRFDFPRSDVQLWVPVSLPEWIKARRSRWLYAMGRLKDGVSPAAAQQEMDTVTKALADKYPRSNTGWGTRLVPLQETVVGKVRPALLILLTTVGLVLLLACANIANLEMARAAGRRREMAIRSAMGASPAAVFRQLLAEGLVLAILGGLLGLLLAQWSLRLLVSSAPKFVPRLSEIGIDGRVLLFTLGLSVLTGVVFSLVPVFSTLRANLVGNLREGEPQASASGGSVRFRRVLAAAEMAIALVLLSGAGLLLASLLRLHQVQPGFDPNDVLTAELVLSPRQYPKDSMKAVFFRELTERVRRIPGVAVAGGISDLPLAGTNSSESFTIEGRPVDPTGYPEAGLRVVMPDYFKALHIPLLKGRDFSPRDAADAPKVVIVNQVFAEHYWPRDTPLGKHIAFTGADKAPKEIIGVIADLHDGRLDAPAVPELYVTYEQHPDIYDSMILVARSKLDTAQLATAVRAQVASLDPQQPVSNVRTLNRVLADSTSQSKLFTSLLGAFAGLALILSALGVYSIIAYSVAQRRHELGIRIALGALRGDVLKLVVMEGVVVAAAGIVAGFALAWVATKWLSSLLYGIQPHDSLIFAGSAALMAIVALAASLIPAVRASRVDPLVAFRTT